MQDLEDWDELPLFWVSYSLGLNRMYGVYYKEPMARATSIVVRSGNGCEHTPDTLDFTPVLGVDEIKNVYTKQSKRWKDLNAKPGGQEERPWTKNEVKALIRKRERESERRAKREARGEA
jgi:hypothetical protein